MCTVVGCGRLPKLISSVLIKYSLDLWLVDGHARQDSMDPNELWNDGELKPLERRKQQEQRYLAHSLVGTPNYIAPEVLLRLGK
jgi:serine/threonine protein kinase